MNGQMKVLLDQTNCLYRVPYKFKEIYLLTTAESNDPETPENAINGLKGWLKVFNQAKLKGTIFTGGTIDDGTINGHKELEEAYNMGRSI
ncbi:MAG: hypothetical protein SOI44_07990 [Lactimicrobium sp.]|uniref:hypothetical protein n=1 Tax=Lactimicrobium sp. TaxID=2563780 RepID=UPI002F35851B